PDRATGTAGRWRWTAVTSSAAWRRLSDGSWALRRRTWTRARASSRRCSREYVGSRSPARASRRRAPPSAQRRTPPLECDRLRRWLGVALAGGGVAVLQPLRSELPDQHRRGGLDLSPDAGGRAARLVEAEPL